MMISPTDVCLGISLLVVLLGCFHCFVTAEDCYRGDAHLDYDNPCKSDRGQPSKLPLCPKGMRLADPCTENCVYCTDGTYQDTFTNCDTCLPCTAAEECPPGQVITSNCTIYRNAVCGCPAPPPCPTCESCPTVTPCPSETPCPVQTECLACECATNTPEPQHSSELRFLRECPPNVLAVTYAANRTKSVEWDEPQATGSATVVQSHHPGDSFVLGNTTVIYLFEIGPDTIYCSFVVTVIVPIGCPDCTQCPGSPCPVEATRDVCVTCKPGFQCCDNCCGGQSCLPINPDVCQRPCYNLYSPVCGSDGVTYGNLCVFVSAQCLRPYLNYTHGECETETAPTIPPPSTGEPTEGSQENCGHRPCWKCWTILSLIVLAIVLIGAGFICWKKYRAKGNKRTAQENKREQPQQTIEGQEMVVPEQTPEPLQRERNNSIGDSGNGEDSRSSASSDNGSNRGNDIHNPFVRDAARLNSCDQDPDSNLSSDLGPISGAAVYSGGRGDTGETDNSEVPLLSQTNSLPSGVEPAQNPGPSRMQSHQQSNRTAPLQSHSNSSLSSAEPPQNPGPSRMQSDQPDNSATPLRSQLHSLSSVEPVQNPGPSRMQSGLLSHPEELITKEDRRDSVVTEMELRWLAKIVYQDGHYLNKRTLLYGHLNIDTDVVSRIKQEHLSNNSVNDLETEIFTILYHGRLQRDKRREVEDSRGHLIKQLYTFNWKLAEAYAKYINDCEDFSIMWRV